MRSPDLAGKLPEELLREFLGEGELVGDASFLCHELAGLEVAGPRDLSFVKGRAKLASAEARVQALREGMTFCASCP